MWLSSILCHIIPPNCMKKGQQIYSVDLSIFIAFAYYNYIIPLTSFQKTYKAHNGSLRFISLSIKTEKYPIDKTIDAPSNKPVRILLKLSLSTCHTYWRRPSIKHGTASKKDKICKESLYLLLLITNKNRKIVTTHPIKVPVHLAHSGK